MPMSKKNYEAIAKTFREVAGIEAQSYDTPAERVAAVETLDCLAEALCAPFLAENSRFQRSRFLAACRGEDSKDSAGRKVKYSTRPGYIGPGCVKCHVFGSHAPDCPKVRYSRKETETCLCGRGECPECGGKYVRVSR